ncbi:MAG: hypothetical protein P0111_01225 [Nitrospira sp.]|nr:hypothetical protein [Nitrospira sp.]
MQRIPVRRIALSTLIAAFLTATTVAKSATASEDLARGHTKITGVVTEKAGALVVTTPGGAKHQINENISRRHGHEPFKAGDEVIAVLDENNYIIDMHLKGHEIQHQFETGKLIHLGMTNKQIKIHTPEGDKIFPLTEQAQKTKGFAEGTLVTIELNEAGAAIDVHQADIGSGKQ